MVRLLCSNQICTEYSVSYSAFRKSQNTIPYSPGLDNEYFTISILSVLIISWIGLIILSIKSPPSHSKWQAYLSSLNINTAFRYAAESIAEFMNRGSILFHTSSQDTSISDRVLGWSDIFEDASYMFSCGEVLPIFIFYC